MKKLSKLVLSQTKSDVEPGRIEVRFDEPIVFENEEECSIFSDEVSDLVQSWTRIKYTAVSFTE